MNVNVTEAIRRTQVISADVAHLTRADTLFPKWAVEADCAEIWQVFLVTKSGMRREKHTLVILHTEEEVSNFLAIYRPGTFLDDTLPWPGDVDARKRYVQDAIDTGSIEVGGAGDAGDAESPMAMDVLREAGVLNNSYSASEAVLGFAGPERCAQLEERYGENWPVVAEYEYCFTTFPPSSPAYVAALYRYHYYISGDDFAAGYIWRDLESLILGVEAAALSSTSMRASAGKAGSEASRAARDKRRVELFDAIEIVVARNPDMTQYKAALINLAVDHCKQNNPTLWKLGRGQAADYLAEIAAGQAGPDLEKRYAAVFSARRPPRRQSA